MESAWTSQLLQYVSEEWRSIPDAYRPWGVWAALHAPLPAAASVSSLPPRSAYRAWFLRDDLILPEERSVWEYIRFHVVHFERPWDSAGLASRDPRFSRPTFLIGIASFAAYSGSQDIYLETAWGGLWGRGRRLTLNERGLLASVEELWVS